MLILGQLRAGQFAQMRPRANTSTRSQISASCSASELAHTTTCRDGGRAQCARRSARAVPTSTPCVGSSSSKKLGSRFIQRAIRTFCTLPPDIDESFIAGSFGRTS